MSRALILLRRRGGSKTRPYILMALGNLALQFLGVLVPWWFRTLSPSPRLPVSASRLRRAPALVGVMIALLPALALANGGTIQVSNQRSGPYTLTIFTDPTPVRVGVVDVSTLVQRADGDEVVRDAEVTVIAEPVGHQAEGGSYQATHELATNKLYYAANVSLPAEGRWRIEVRVTGDIGEGEAAFEVEASQGSLLDTPLLLLLLAVPPVLLLVWWFSRAERK